MSPFNSRQFILVFVASAVAAGSLLTPDTASADLALFRVEQRWHDFPDPPVTTPGGAGMYQGYIQPYTDYYNPAVASVQPSNPVGGAFTLPQSFITFTGTNTIISRVGYTTISYWSYHNGPGRFGPNNGGTGPTRIVFPTTMGNPSPTYNGTAMKWTGGNYGTGLPVTPTTTFWRYNRSRAGSINVTPGARRFGGTFRMFYGPNAGWYQYIYYFMPAYFKVYGDYLCFDEGKFGCTPSSFVSDVGDTTAIYQSTWFHLNLTGTGTGPGYSKNTAKATTWTTPYGTWPTKNGNASYLVGQNRRYLNVIHPWTTGYAKVHNPRGSPKVITPQASGYDYKPTSYVPTLTVTRSNAYWNFNTTNQTLTTYTNTNKQYLYGVGRIVSMVRPRLIHTYTVDYDAQMVTNTWNVARLWRLKVFFLPEPAGMLLLGAGIATLLSLSAMRTR
jgi:hypothetical protein